MANKSRFQNSDAWIFLSLRNDQDGTSLDDLIAKADWMNHAIPMEKEVEDAIGRLSKADLVHFEAGKLFLTDSGKELYEYIYSKRGSLLTLWGKLEKYLNKADFPVLELTDFKLPAGELETAYQKYHERFWRTYREMESKEKKRRSS